MRSRGANYVVAGNRKTLQFNMEDTKNNHEEADTLFIYLLYNARINESSVLVHATDPDVFVLLTAHRHRMKCKCIFFGFEQVVVNIDAVHTFLGLEASICLLTAHIVTGCNTCGKFNGISKKRWIGLFINLLKD